jgi:hypothetical protein
VDKTILNDHSRIKHSFKSIRYDNSINRIITFFKPIWKPSQGDLYTHTDTGEDRWLRDTTFRLTWYRPHRNIVSTFIKLSPSHWCALLVGDGSRSSQDAATKLKTRKRVFVVVVTLSHRPVWVQCCVQNNSPQQGLQNFFHSSLPSPSKSSMRLPSK